MTNYKVNCLIWEMILNKGWRGTQDIIVPNNLNSGGKGSFLAINIDKL